MTHEAGITLSVLQPGYLPWLGFFDQLRRCDVFVLYDDVQFDKHGWRNRNRVKSPQGVHWLTVPVRHKGLGKQKILDVEIDNSTAWGRKHVATIQQCYAKAPFVRTYLPTLTEVLQERWTRLVDLDVALIEIMCGWLGVHRPIIRSSTLGIEGEQSDRLRKFCGHFGARCYFSGVKAQDYLDVNLFTGQGIAVQWQTFEHPVYPQQHGEFVSHLSALDLLLNCGEESPAILARGLAQEAM